MTGQLVGYVFFTITPCMESRNALIGVRGGIYVKKEFRGSVGINIHLFSLKKLKERGVHAAILKSGFRGSGAKMKDLYASLGATSVGELFFLPLKD